MDLLLIRCDSKVSCGFFPLVFTFMKLFHLNDVVASLVYNCFEGQGYKCALLISGSQLVGRKQ